MKIDYSADHDACADHYHNIVVGWQGKPEHYPKSV
jgi:hypothetical protein